MKANLCPEDHGGDRTDKRVKGKTFDEYASMYGSEMLGYLIKRNLPRCIDPEDVVQDTLLDAWRQWDRFRGDSSVRTWFYRQLRGKLVDHLRRKYRSVGIKNLDHLGEVTAPQHHGPEQEYELEELEILIATEIRRLPSKHREVCHMIMVEGIPPRDVMLHLQISANACHTRVHRGRKRLRKRFIRYGYGGQD